MVKRPFRWMTTALVVGTLTACDVGQGLTDVTVDPSGQDIFTELTSADLSASLTETDLYDSALTEASASLYKEITGATLVSTTTTKSGIVAIAIVGPAGGTITAGDHWLVIPRDAVLENTEFRMEAFGGTNILVDLSARTVGSGAVVSSFPVPLTLRLSYRDISKNVDARRLRNVYLYLDSPDYLVPLLQTRNTKTKTISSPILHFSKYGMAIE